MLSLVKRSNPSKAASVHPVVFHHAAGRELRAELAALARHGLQVRVVVPEDRRGLREALADAVALWQVLEPATAALLAEAPRLRLIQQLGPGAGAETTVDLAAARAGGIAVCDAPGAAAPAVAEMTLALMLACLRRVPALDRAVRAGTGWALPAEEQAFCGELGGRTVGLLGYGAVAARVAPVLRALGARPLYWSRHREPEASATFAPLRELMEASDVVSLHLPLTPETERLVDAAALGLMKPGAVLVNTAHGGLVDEAALAEALRCGHLRAAGLDVFAAEPLPRDHPLLALANVVVSPRAAWRTPEALRRALLVAVENSRRLRAGQPLRHRVA
jgi:phosphoglycerate dehydrogenase-like enzyme